MVYSPMDYFRAQLQSPSQVPNPMVSYFMQQKIDDGSAPAPIPMQQPESMDDIFTQYERSGMAPAPTSSRRSSPPRNIESTVFEPTSGSAMEAESRSSIDKILESLTSQRSADRQNDRNMQWMSFFSKLASSKDPSLLGGLGEATGALTETTGKQSESNKLLDRAAIQDQLKYEQWKEEQDMKKSENASEAELRAAQAKYYQSGGSGAAGAGMGGATGVLAQRYMNEMAKQGMPITFPEALYAVQTGFRQGTQMQGGEIVPFTGVPEAKGLIKEGEAAGEIRGKGEITPKEQKERGQKQVSLAVSDLKSKYEDLDKSGGIVNPDKGAMENIGASVKSSGPGQFTQGIVGTKEQSLRNDIKSMEPVIINSIRQATGMSAKAMDSNAELLFYRAAVKAGDVKAQISALDRIDKLYGLGNEPKKNGAAPSDGSTQKKPLSAFGG